LSEYDLKEEAEEGFGIESEDYGSTKVAELLHCLETLHENYKTILTLHFIEGYDYEEICDILQISYANCRTMISRAKESLRTKLTVSA
jgi:RNA polymerase sigma-70 factor (ECF subfamily)